MASDATFEMLWKRILLYAPLTPLPLAQTFINSAYSRALEHELWSQSFKESAFTIPAEYATGTITVANGSATVTGSGTTWTSAMVGRQLMVGDQAPFWDIQSVESATSLTLTTTYIGADAAGSAYSIVLVYVQMPTDFMSFRSVVDVENNWKLRLDVDQTWIDRVDAQRTTSSSSPWVLAACKPSGQATTSERVRYEIWPRGTAEKTYPIKYIPKFPLLSAAADRPIFPIRGDILIEGALAELALWPGTKDAPNPYHNIQQHREHERRFKEFRDGLEREAQNTNQTWITYADSHIPWAPVDAAFLQVHGIPF